MMNHFQFSCGATGPLRLIGGGREWTLSQPFAVIGRDGASDVVLNHRQVSRRHAYLQVIQGQMFCMDLGSRTGIQWHDGRPSASGWVDPDQGIRIGPFEVRSRSDGDLNPAPVVDRWGNPDPLKTPLPGPEPSLEIEPAPGAGSLGDKLPALGAPLRDHPGREWGQVPDPVAGPERGAIPVRPRPDADGDLGRRSPRARRPDHQWNEGPMRPADGRR